MSVDINWKLEYKVNLKKKTEIYFKFFYSLNYNWETKSTKMFFFRMTQSGKYSFYQVMFFSHIVQSNLNAKNMASCLKTSIYNQITLRILLIDEQ